MPEASSFTRFSTIIAPCLFLLALATCGKDSPTKTESPTTPPAPPPPPPVQSVPTSIVITPSPVALTSITFIIPARANWADRLYRITLSGPEGVAMLGGEDELEEEDGPAAALLLEPGTGRVRGILRDWPEPGVTDSAARRVVPEPGLEVRISRGIPDVVDW